MSDAIHEQGCSSNNDELNEPQKISPDILNNNNSIKIDEKFVLKLIKESKNINKEVKDSCKVLHFSSEWNFENIITTIDGLDSKEYQQLFIFIIEATNLGFNADQQQDFSNKFTKIQEKLLKFSATRPLILQLTSEDENVSKIYYKDETSQFNVIDQQHNKEDFEEIENFSSFMCLFLNDKIHNFEDKIIKYVNKTSNLLIFLRFLRTLTFSDKFFERLILEVTKKGSKAEFLAILDGPFDDCGNWLSSHAQKYLSDVIYINKSESRSEIPEGADNGATADSSSAPSTSVLYTAIKNDNKEVIDCLIKIWNLWIQQLPFDHQLTISSDVFETNQLDVLCDLVDIADFPFPINFQSQSTAHERLEAIVAERVELEDAIKSENFEGIDNFLEINPSLKVVYNINNNSALKLAAESKKKDVYNHLKLRGFYTANLNEELEEFDKEVKKYAVQQRKRNVSEGILDDQMSVNLLCNRSLIHNKSITKEQNIEYRKKIRCWYEDINKIKNGPEFLNVAASCDRLKIIFDFENDTVSHVLNIPQMLFILFQISL